MATTQAAKLNGRRLDRRCPGSRHLPLAGSIDTLSGHEDTGLCPVCGKRFRLGYALLLPSHPTPTLLTM